MALLIQDCGLTKSIEPLDLDEGLLIDLLGNQRSLVEFAEPVAYMGVQYIAYAFNALASEDGEPKNVSASRLFEAARHQPKTALQGSVVMFSLRDMLDLAGRAIGHKA